MPDHSALDHSVEATICNKRGLHARAAARVATLSEGFAPEVFLTYEGQTVSTLSIMGMMMLGAAKGAVLIVSATGTDATQAVEQVAALIAAGFHETD